MNNKMYRHNIFIYIYTYTACCNAYSGFRMYSEVHLPTDIHPKHTINYHKSVF